MGEVSIADVEGAAALQQELRSQRDRHRAFLKKVAPGPRGQGGWGVRRRCRKKSWQYLCCLHNQLVQVVPAGLKHFCLAESLEDRGDPLHWPRLSCGPDQGSDGTCAFQFAQRVLHLNCDLTWDVSHGVHNDILNGIKHAGLYSHLLLSLLRLNCPLGPWSEDTRWKECQASLNELLSTESHSRCELFQAFLQEKLDRLSADERAQMKDPSKEVWQNLPSANPFVKKGTKVSLGRFVNCIRAMRAELPHFVDRKFIYLHTCLELDMMSGAKFRKLALQGHTIDKSTSSKKETHEESALRKSCQNQMVLTCMWMLDADAEQIDRLIVFIMEPWEQWHGFQNKTLRTAAAALDWSQAQLQGDFVNTLTAVWRRVHSERLVGECMLIAPFRGFCMEGKENEIVREDELAAKAISLASGVTFWRLKRSAWLLLGWNSRSVLFLSSDETCVRKELASLRQDLQAFEVAKRNVDDVSGLSRFVQRSQFALPSVQQIALLFGYEGAIVDEEKAAFLRKAHTRMYGSQVVEDGFNVMKNCKPYQNRRGTLQSSFRGLIERKPLSRKHKYEEVAPTCAPVGRSLRIPSEAYKVTHSDMPREFLPIMSFSQKTSWPSLRPEDVSLPFAETRVLVIAEGRGELHKLQHAWLGQLLHSSHNMIVRKKQPDGVPETGWFFPLGCWYDSVVIMVPVRFIEADAVLLQVVVEVDHSARDERCFFDVCYDVDQWEARRIAF